MAKRKGGLGRKVSRRKSVAPIKPKRKSGRTPEKPKLIKRLVAYTDKLRSYGWPQPRKGYGYQKVTRKDLYRQVKIKTGSPLKVKGRIKLFSKFVSKKKAGEYYDKKYPDFPVYLEGREDRPVTFGKLAKAEKKALKEGRTTRVLELPPKFERGNEFEEKTHENYIIKKAYKVKTKTGKISIRELAGSKSASFPVPKQKKLKFVYTFSDGTTQESPKYERRTQAEIHQFKARKVQGHGSDYRPGSKDAGKVLFQSDQRIGPGSGIETTRQLVTKALATFKIPAKGNLKISFDWRVFEGMYTDAKELKGKSGASFKFNPKKAGSAFSKFYRRIVNEKLAEAVNKKIKMIFLPGEGLSQEQQDLKVLKKAKLSKTKRAKLVKQLMAEGKIPRSALGLFFETQILKAAKARGVIISGGSEFRHMHGEKKGLRSLKNEKWESQFSLNLMKA